MDTLLDLNKAVYEKESKSNHKTKLTSGHLTMVDRITTWKIYVLRDDACLVHSPEVAGMALVALGPVCQRHSRRIRNGKLEKTEDAATTVPTSAVSTVG